MIFLFCRHLREFCELPLWEICIPRIVQAEEILIGCFVECQSIKKVGGRRSVEGLYQALFTERNENRAWSQVITLHKPFINLLKSQPDKANETYRILLDLVIKIGWRKQIDKRRLTIQLRLYFLWFSDILLLFGVMNCNGFLGVIHLVHSLKNSGRALRNRKYNGPSLIPGN